MRDEETPAEIMVRNHLIEYLERAYGRVVVDPSITDKPEIVFEINGDKFGCEFVGIDLREFYLYGKSDIGEDRLQSLNHPIEPYYIFNEIIKKKMKLLSSYKTRANTEKIWLLVHDLIISTHKGKGMFIPYSVHHKDYVEQWFYIIVENRPNPFHKILYLRSDRSKQDIIETSYFKRPKPQRTAKLIGGCREIDQKIKVRAINDHGRPRRVRIDFNSSIDKEYKIPMKFSTPSEVLHYLRENACILHMQ